MTFPVFGVLYLFRCDSVRSDVNITVLNWMVVEDTLKASF